MRVLRLGRGRGHRIAPDPKLSNRFTNWDQALNRESTRGCIIPSQEGSFFNSPYPQSPRQWTEVFQPPAARLTDYDVKGNVEQGGESGKP